MHAFCHLVFRIKSNLIAWRSNGMNSIDNDLISTELEIQSLELTDSNGISGENTHSILVFLYNKCAALHKAECFKMGPESSVSVGSKWG